MARKFDIDDFKGEPDLAESLAKIGICSTCNHLNGCAFRRNSAEPIAFCEEFDDYSPHQELCTIELEKAGAPLVEESKSSEYKGLCVNCEVRKTCALPKAEGGIWHCEEYE